MAARLARLLVALGLVLGAVLPSPAAAAVVRLPTSQDIAASSVPDRRADPTYARSYFGARYYRADIARFTTVDPELDIKAALVEPQRWNRYAYVTNNPLKYTDPDGKNPLLITGGIGAAVYGGWAVYQNVSHGKPWYNNVGLEAGKGFLVGATLGLAAPALAGVGAAEVTGAALGSGGTWVASTEAMSARAAAFQTQVTGRAGEVFLLNGVKFDGMMNNVLQEAKGPGYATFVKDGAFVSWFKGAADFVAQAQRQLAAAGGTQIRWTFAEAAAAEATRALFKANGIKGIQIVVAGQ